MSVRTNKKLKGKEGQIDEWLAILCPFQQYLSCRVFVGCYGVKMKLYFHSKNVSYLLLYHL